MSTLSEKITAVYDKHYDHDESTAGLISDLVELFENENAALQQDLDNVTNAELGG